MPNSYSISAQPVGTRPISHISPSLFSSLKECLLRAVWIHNQIPGLLPISPSARLGTVVHQIIEISAGHVMDEADFLKLWDLFVLDQEEQMRNSWFERHLVPLDTTASDFHVKRKQCFLLLRARDNKARSIKPNSSSEFHEHWLRSKDGLVMGKVDEIRFGEGGATIIDYKTGNIFGQSVATEILSEYEEQLKLYAALFYEEYEQWPSDLIVVGLDGRNHHIGYEKNECLALLEESKDLLRRVNKIIEADRGSNRKTQLRMASPSQTKCRYCLYRPICEPYFLARQGDLTGDWPNDKWGIITGKTMLRNGRAKITLIPLFGTASTNIRALRLERHHALDAFKKIAAFSLYSDNSCNSYKEGPFTTIYGIE